MPLPGPGKFEDALSDDSVRKIVCKARGRAGHFKSEIQSLLGFRIDIEVVEVGRDSHGNPPPKAIPSMNRLVRSAIYSQCHSNRRRPRVRASYRAPPLQWGGHNPAMGRPWRGSALGTGKSPKPPSCLGGPASGVRRSSGSAKPCRLRCVWRCEWERESILVARL